MKQIKRTLVIVTAALAVVGCNRGDGTATTSTNEELGQVSFSCSIEGGVAITTKSTKTESLYEIPENLIPSSDDLTLNISGSYTDPDSEEEKSYSYGPLLLSTYSSYTPYMYVGSDYLATFSYGNADDEGESMPYFYGDVTFDIIARGSTTEEVEVSLSNSMIALEVVDDIFMNYYSDASFTVTTGAGNSFEFVVPDDKVIFVQAGTSLTLSGSATRNGASVIFNSTTLGTTTAAQTLHTIEINVGTSIGGGDINIILDDNVVEMDVTTIEVNPEM